MSRTKTDKLRRIAELCDELRPAKKRMMDVLATIENERLGAAMARRLGTIIGRLEDLQSAMR